MILDKIEISKCNGCTACASVCFKQCIKMKENSEGFFYPVVNKENCINCDLCDRVCPINKALQYNEITQAYAVINKNEEERLQSSSGGVFSVISNYILEKKGYIVGAAYDEEFEVKHIIINCKEDLWKLRGAKYSQSRLENIFSDIKKVLDTGNYVLFSGTPCQVSGLKAFLKKKYDKLVLIDTICHGVPSPLVWKKYVEYRSKIDNNGELPKFINLRSKASGWSKYSYSVEFKYDQTKYSRLNGQDPFMKAFVGNYCLRESCYDCLFKSIQRVSDFTIGDYWGIWNQKPEMDDNKGTSLLLVHSRKGNKILENIIDQMECTHVDLNVSIEENPSMIRSSSLNENRSVFIDFVKRKGFEKAIHKYKLIDTISTREKFLSIIAKIKDYSSNIK